MAGRALFTPPTIEPVPVDELLTQVGLSEANTESIAQLESLGRMAREWVENATRRQLITATWNRFLDEWPSDDRIELPRPPLQSVVHVKYYDEAGAQQTFAASSYHVFTQDFVGGILLKPAASWPALEDGRPNVIEIRYVAGYGNAAANVPEGLRHAIRLMTAHHFDNREPILVGSISKELELSISSLIGPYMVVEFV